MFGKPVVYSNRGGPGERVQHEMGGLQFHIGDHLAPAGGRPRAATEERLSGALRQNLPEAPSRPDMAWGFLALYRGGAADEASEDKALADQR